MKKILLHPLTLVLFTCIFALLNIEPVIILMRHGVFAYKSVPFQLASLLSAWFFMVFLPLKILRSGNRNIHSYGFRLPDNKREAAFWTGGVIVLFLPIIWIFAQQTSFQNYYTGTGNIWMFAFFNILGGIYYIAEEFLFRGFLQFGLWDKLKWNTVWVVNIIFAVLHTGKPAQEVIFAFVLGIALSILSRKTNSFLPAAAAHFILALTLNILVVFVYPPIHTIRL